MREAVQRIKRAETRNVAKCTRGNVWKYKVQLIKITLRKKLGGKKNRMQSKKNVETDLVEIYVKEAVWKWKQHK